MKTHKKTFIIAEAGINHNGKLTLAKRLVDAAKKSGADAIKFQIFKTENVITKKAKLCDYQKKNKNSKTLFSLLKNLELRYKDFQSLISHCKKKKIEFMCTADEIDGFNQISKKIKKIKIGSAELNDNFFLKRIAKEKKITLLSTGLSNLKTVKQSRDLLIKEGLPREKIYILHCNSAYPSPDKDINLKVLETYKRDFGVNIGLSDHSPHMLPSILSVSLGARIIEKHFTLNKKFKGPDHSTSLDPIEFKKMIQLIRKAEAILGSSTKKITPSEKKNFKNIRKGIYAKRKILRGDAFTTSNLCVKRPYNGSDIRKFEKLIGKKSRKSYKIDQSVY